MFIALAAALAVLTALGLALPFISRSRNIASRAEHDMEAYRAQLRELDQDVARGIVTEAEAETARVEISRRLLAADTRRETETAAQPSPGSTRIAAALVAALGVPALGAATYLSIGSPGYPDFPMASRVDRIVDFADRPGQEQAEAQLSESGLAPEPLDTTDPEVAEITELLERLETRLAAVPEDATGQLLLARTTARLERYAESWRHYARLIEITGEPDADIFAAMAESMVLAANGYVSPEAEEALERALAGNPDDPQSRYYRALALAQRGEIEAALSQWRALLADAPPGAPWSALVYQRAAQAAEELGQAPPPPPAGAPPMVRAPGPDAGDIAAAQQMAPEDRMAMIEGMVANLAARLEENPDDLEGWLRLLRAYGVLGRDEELRAAAAAARSAFSEDEAALARIAQALE